MAESAGMSTSGDQVAESEARQERQQNRGCLQQMKKKLDGLRTARAEKVKGRWQGRAEAQSEE